MGKLSRKKRGGERNGSLFRERAGSDGSMNSGSSGKRPGKSERGASRVPCMWTVGSGDEGGSAPGLV